MGHHLPPQSRTELVDFDSEGEPHGPFSSTIDLLGDGSVRLLSTPGHTRGHMSVVLRLAGREALLAADAGYALEENIREGALPTPVTTYDDHLWRRSVREIQLFMRERPDTLVVPSHDMRVIESLDEVYA